MEIRKLTLNEMERIEGGRKVLDCIGQIVSGLGVFWGTGAALILGTHPIGWAFIGLSAIGLAAGLISNPTACDN